MHVDTRSSSGGKPFINRGVIKRNCSGGYFTIFGISSTVVINPVTTIIAVLTITISDPNISIIFNCIITSGSIRNLFLGNCYAISGYYGNSTISVIGNGVTN